MSSERESRRWKVILFEREGALNALVANSAGAQTASDVLGETYLGAYLGRTICTYLRWVMMHLLVFWRV
jgi:hypothetical protein